MTAVSSSPRSADALESQPILDGRAPPSHAAAGGDEGSWQPTTPPSVWRRWADDPLVRAAAVNLALIATWYFFSTLLSLFNKIVVGKEHGLMGMGAFPAPFFMSGTQFMFQHLIARAVLALGWVQRKSDGSQSWHDYLRKVVPNGVATGLDIGFSNYSLVFITLSFYVMCKSTTPLFLLFFAIAWGIEKPSWSLAAVVSVISAGLLLLVYGETKFHLVGFILVMTAAMLAGLRWTITQVLLQDSGGSHGSKKHGGPVEVLYQLTPVMGVTLLATSLGYEKLWATLPASPYFASVGMALLSLLLIFAGAIIAFAMVVAEFALIANTSALTFMVAGTFKEIVTVAAAVLFLGENFTWINGMGLLVLILGVVLFNYLKFQKLRSELAPGGITPTASAAKLSSEGEGEPGSGGGSEVEMMGGGGGGGYGALGPFDTAASGGFGGSGSLAGTPRRATAAHHLSARRSGSGEHQVLILGLREGSLVDDEALLRHSPRRPMVVRSRGPSPTAAYAAQHAP